MPGQEVYAHRLSAGTAPPCISYMPALRIAEVLARFCARFSLKFYFAGLEPDPRRHRGGQGVEKNAGLVALTPWKPRQPSGTFDRRSCSQRARLQPP